MMSSYILHAPAGSFRAFKILIAAEYNGIDIKIPEFDATKATILSPTGKAPVLQTPSGQSIFESHSIARYIARMKRDTGLLGSGLIEEANIDSWCDFCANSIELPACVWWYPVVGYMKFQHDAYEKAKTDLAQALTILNTHLENRQFLINDNNITLADITIVSALIYPFKLVCDEKYRKPFPNVIRWFNACVCEKQFESIIGTVVLCKKELR